jgi:hypothetical protein
MDDTWNNNHRNSALYSLAIAIDSSVIDKDFGLRMIENSWLRSPMLEENIFTSISRQDPWLIKSRLLDCEYKSIIFSDSSQFDYFMQSMIFVIPLSSHRIVDHFLMLLVEAFQLIRED